MINLVALLLLFIPSYCLGGEDVLYKKYCAKCHGENRLGKLAPPLLPIFMKNISLEKFENIIKNGIPATSMPSFPSFSKQQIEQLYNFLKTPKKVIWKQKNILDSLQVLNQSIDIKPFTDLRNITLLVERGKSSIWVLENEKILGKFNVSNVHGGIKFSKSQVFIPSRDGWVSKVDLKDAKFKRKIRPCIYLRNIDVSADGKYVLASCWLPESIVILDKISLKPVKVLKLDGKISAIYSLYKKSQAVFTFRDKQGIYILNLKDFNIKSFPTKSPITGFFIDPFDRYIIGSSKKEKKLQVYSLKDGNLVFESSIPSMPHLFSVAVWYQNGNFYFATRHIKSPVLSIWRMYNWKLEKQIKLSGAGFFVRTHPDTPYLWTDVSSDKVALINKRNLHHKEITIVSGKRYLHTEFSGDGNIAYLSIYDKDGYLVLLNSKTLKQIKKFPASLPVGKYNYVNKTRKFLPQLLGKQIYIQKCWGCHHPLEEAFAPSFKKIASTRDDSLIMAQILNPGGTYKLLGYKENYMPRFNFSKEELEAIVSFIKTFKEEN